MAKALKLVLDTAYIEEEFFEDVLLIGIVSPKPAHQFIWHINEALNLDFIRNHAFELNIKEVFYTLFTYEEKDKLREHFIYTNRKQQHYLLPEAKNIDYLWMIKGGHDSQNKLNEILSFLQKIKIVTYAFEIDCETLKNRSHLIL